MPEPIYSTTPPESVYQTSPPPGPTPPSGPTQPIIPPIPKKKFPLKILAIVGGAVLLVFILVTVFRSFSSKGTTSGGGEIVWWGLWEDESVVEPLIQEYQQQNPKVKITYTKQSQQDYRERLTNALARGTGPDIFRFHNTWVPMFKNELDILPSTVMSAAEYSQTFYPIAASDLTYGTGLVGIPLMYDGLALFVNDDIFVASGKTVPTTWDDLRTVARELTIKDEEEAIVQAGVALGRTENVDHWPEILGLMMLQNGVRPTNPTGKLAEDAITFFTIFSSVDGIWDATLPPSTQAFAAGKVAMYLAPSWRAFEIRQQNPNLNFKTVKVPQLAKTNPNDPDVAYATYWAEGVWTRSANKAEAWNFLKFLSEKESLQKMYLNSTRTRLFGEPYSRVEMASLLADDPIVSGIINGAQDAQSWYLASRTFDGPTGINSQINKYFEDGINAVNGGIPVTKALETVSTGVNQVLSQYGLVR